MRKHPHARGEDPRECHQSSRRSRNTPTHVGKTSAASTSARKDWKHPHARGEDHVLHEGFTVFIETPPRTWGRHGGNRGGAMATRNTPTHVGKTEKLCCPEWPAEKHPHARGEDMVEIEEGQWLLETPPRTWGRRKNFAVRNGRQRNTPTHVGKTPWGRGHKDPS